MQFASLQVCDDIRLEATGKTSLIGVYSSEIIVQSLPAKLDKLFFIIKIQSLLSDPIKPIHTRIELPGKDPIIIPFQGDTLDAESRNTLAKDGAVYGIISSVFPISPCELTEEGRIKVYIATDKADEVYAGSIKIISANTSAVSLNPDILISSISFFAKHMSEDDSNHLAKEILKSISLNIPQNVIDSVGNNSNLLIPLPNNSFRIIFGKKRAKKPKISVKFSPESTNYELFDVGTHGFSVKILDVTGFQSFTFDEE